MAAFFAPQSTTEGGDAAAAGGGIYLNAHFFVHFAALPPLVRRSVSQPPLSISTRLITGDLRGRTKQVKKELRTELASLFPSRPNLESPLTGSDNDILPLHRVASVNSPGLKERRVVKACL